MSRMWGDFSSHYHLMSFFSSFWVQDSHRQAQKITVKEMGGGKYTTPPKEKPEVNEERTKRSSQAARATRQHKMEDTRKGAHIPIRNKYSEMKKALPLGSKQSRPFYTNFCTTTPNTSPLDTISQKFSRGDTRRNVKQKMANEKCIKFLVFFFH